MDLADFKCPRCILKDPLLRMNVRAHFVSSALFNRAALVFGAQLRVWAALATLRAGPDLFVSPELGD